MINLVFSVYPNDDPDTAAKKLAKDLRKEGWYSNPQTGVNTNNNPKDLSKGNNKNKSTVEERKKPAVPTFKYSKIGKRIFMNQ